jgi:serine/threonine-protein kinase
MVRAYPALLLSLLTAVAPAPACGGPPRAGAPSATVQSAIDAELLFDQGRRLVAMGHYAEACVSFLESERLDHGVGTLLNLADCYEKTGQNASAWAVFRSAAAAAITEGQPDREHIAREREIALLPQLAHLTIAPPRGGLPPGSEVHRDGILVSPWLWNAPVPVDPGDHAVVVAAPGKIDYSTTVHVSKQSTSTFVARIPELKNRPAPPPTAPVPPAAPPTPPMHPRAKAGLILLGVGGAGVVVGAIFGVRALGLKGDSADHCPVADICDPTGIALRSSAHDMGNAATVAFLAAGASLTGGLVLYATAPQRHGLSASFGLSGGTAGVTMGATW